MTQFHVPTCSARPYLVQHRAQGM